MFKQLRNKFLILNMSIISIMMIMSFSVIYLITYANVQAENRNKLRSLSIAPIGIRATQSALNGKPGEPPEKDGVVIGEFAARVIPSDYALSFAIQVNENGGIINIKSHIDMPDETYAKAAELAWQSKKNNSLVTFNNKKWIYMATPVVIAVKIHEGNVSPDNGGRSVIIKSNNGLEIFPLDDGKPRSNDAIMEKLRVINETEKGYQITFLDVTESYKTLIVLLMTFVSVGIAMLFAIFLISAYFANRAILPISVAWDKQRQFITDASHELKTPLSIISANYDALMTNEDESIKSQKKWLEYIKVEINRMGKLVNDLLYLAKTDDTDIRTQYLPFDISNVTNGVLLSMEAVAFEKGITISYDIEPDLIMKSDCEKVKQVIMILLDNAIKYSDTNGNIDILLKKSRNNILFSVKNFCAGISKEDLTKLFDRFYRNDPSRAHDNGGYGLGLSIAKAVVEQLGGKIYTEIGEKDSITFTFIL